MKKYLFVVLTIVFTCFHALGQGKLVWATLGAVNGLGKINSCSVDGTSSQNLITFPGDTHGMKIDEENELIYWTNPSEGQIMRTDFTFQSLDTFMVDIDKPEKLELDLIHQKIYWSSLLPFVVHRANMDGTESEIIFEQSTTDVELDPTAEFLYYATGAGIIGRINTGSLFVDTIIMASDGISEMEIDWNEMKIYWVTQSFSEVKIQRCNLDGTGLVDLVVGIRACEGLALDAQNQRLYWTEWGGDFPKYIKGVDFDGATIDTVLVLSNDVPGALSFTNSLPVGITKLIKESEVEFDVFPNPTTASFTIKTKQHEIDFIKIIDVHGTLVKIVSENTHHVDVAELPSGIYYVLIGTKGGLGMKKITKI